MLECSLGCRYNFSLRLKFTCFSQLGCESSLFCSLVILVIAFKDVLERIQVKLPLVNVVKHTWDGYLWHLRLVLWRVQVRDFGHDLHLAELFDRATINKLFEDKSRLLLVLGSVYSNGLQELLRD